MKRILSVLLCIGLLFGACSVGAVADSEEDYEYTLFDLFADEATFISYLSPHVAQGETYSSFAVLSYVMCVHEVDFLDYGNGEMHCEDDGYEEYVWYDSYSVPAEVFEDTVALHFELSETLIADLRVADGVGDEETGTALPLYQEETDTYLIPSMGGLGDSRSYYPYSGVMSGDKYEVYFYDVDAAYEWSADDVPGKDCLFVPGYNGSVYACEILGYAKYVMGYDEDTGCVKFYWSEEIDALPTIDGMEMAEQANVVVDGDFIYSVVDDGAALWVAAYGGEDTALTVPASVKGLPVTGVAAEAFYFNETIQSVALPDTVTYIGDSAFDCCSSLTTVNIPSGVEHIGDWAFCYSGIMSIDIPATVTYIGEEALCSCVDLTAVNVAADNEDYVSVDGVLFNKAKTELICYPAGKTATSYVVPDGVKTIVGGAFRDAFYLTDVTLPESLTTIGEIAFAYSGLTSIAIPEGVTEIPYCAFEGCEALTEVTLPSTLTTIEDMAFCLTGLTSVVIPEGVTEIWYGAFGGCLDLTDVVLPSSLQYLDEAVFSSCGLASIVFMGTEDEWELVEKAEYWQTYGEELVPVTFAAMLKDEESGVQVFSADAVEEITLSVKPISNENTAAALKQYDKSVVMDITLLKNGEETQPDSAVTVRVPVPAGMSGKNCAVVRVEADGTLTDMNAVYVNRMLVFTTEHFSQYAVVANNAALGDVDGNGKVNTTDARLTLQYAAGRVEAEALDVSVADVDDNGKVNTTDARLILQKAANRIDAFPAEK